MIMPAAVLVLVFNYLPLAGWIIAFKNYSVGRGIWSSEWVGLKHFKVFFMQGSDYLFVIRNTLVINIVGLILGLGGALLFALLLKELRGAWLAKTLQTVSFFPFFISYVIVYSIINALFSVESGAVNQTLMQLGFVEKGINLLGDSKYSWILIWMLGLWKNTGYNSIIFLAAISGISQEQYESADIDGADRFQKIFHITIPNLMGTLVVLLIINSGYILRSNLDMFFLFTNSMNWETMEVLDMYVYRYGLELGDFSYATAVGILLTTLSLIILFVTNGLSKRYMDKSIL